MSEYFGSRDIPKSSSEYKKQIEQYIETKEKNSTEHATLTSRFKIVKKLGVSVKFREHDWLYLTKEIDLAEYKIRRESHFTSFLKSPTSNVFKGSMESPSSGATIKCEVVISSETFKLGGLITSFHDIENFKKIGEEGEFVVTLEDDQGELKFKVFERAEEFERLMLDVIEEFDYTVSVEDHSEGDDDWDAPVETWSDGEDGEETPATTKGRGTWSEDEVEKFFNDGGALEREMKDMKYLKEIPEKLPKPNFEYYENRPNEFSTDSVVHGAAGLQPDDANEEQFRGALSKVMKRKKKKKQQLKKKQSEIEFTNADSVPKDTFQKAVSEHREGSDVELKEFKRKQSVDDGTEKKKGEGEKETPSQMKETNIKDDIVEEVTKKEPKKRRRPPGWVLNLRGRTCNILFTILAIVLFATFFIGAIVTFSFIVGSLESVKYDEYGIRYHKITKKLVSENVYGPGLYYVGVSQTFFKMPKLAQTVDFSDDVLFTPDLQEMVTRSAEGVRVTIELSYQYVIRESAVYDLFVNFGRRGYEDVMHDETREVVQDIVSVHSILDFFDKRKAIGGEIQGKLNATFTSLGVRLLWFQLREVKVYSGYETAILDKELSELNVTRDRILQTLKIRETEIDTSVAEVLQRKTIILEEAKAEAKRIRSDADEEYERVTKQAVAEYYETIKDELNLTMTQLFKYKYIRGFHENQLNEMIVNMRTPMIVKGE